MLLLVPISFVAVLIYAGYWRTQHSKRRSESWDVIAARLRPSDWSCAKGLWAAYRNAAVMIQLADFAAEHGKDSGLSDDLLESIRTEAFEIRIQALMALVQHMFRISLAKPDAPPAT